jgi:hypothetical protein
MDLEDVYVFFLCFFNKFFFQSYERGCPSCAESVPHSVQLQDRTVPGSGRLEVFCDGFALQGE